MPMSSYPIRCCTRGCKELAVYKIAARWSDGLTQELKTYALSCSACLADWLRKSRNKQVACRLAAGETLESPGIYELIRGCRDPHLIRRDDLEKQLLASAIGTSE